MSKAPLWVEIMRQEKKKKQLVEKPSKCLRMLWVWMKSLTNSIKSEHSCPNFYVKKINPDLIEVWRT